jgi:hypothetical protein
MLNQDMMTTDAFVKLAFNSAELSLNVEQMESIGVVVHMNVSTLLEQYTPRVGDQSAFPIEPASMLARAIGPLGTQVRSIYDRVVALWGPLLLQEEKPLTFLRSMMDQAQLVTGLRQVSRTSILPRVKALMGLANTSCPDPIGYLTSIGFDEHAADTLYNGDNCRDIFSLFIIVVLFRFIETLPLPRGNQSLMGVPTAHGAEPLANGTNDHDGRDEHATPDPVAALRLELLQMMRDMQTGMMAQIAAHLGNSRGPAQGDMNAVSNLAYQRLEDSLQPDLPFHQAIRGGDSGLAVLNC